MRHPFVFASSLLAPLALSATAHAATWYVSPTGTACVCDSRANPCSLAAAASGAVAGDEVVLMDGVYKEQSLYVKNSGTSSAWITFRADDCATPIIEGPGVAPDADNQDGGVGSAEATYIKFIGIVSRGWNTGFGNGWTGEGTTNSNGNWDIQYCAAYSNGRTGFTFYSASNFSLKNSISAHNGSSTLHSWSSGVTLYASTGGDIIQGNVSFENMDAQNHSDGSGFIVDETSDGATFVNNVAFRNGGSCLRLTKSKNTRFINNTCYHDAQDTAATGPTNPSELYFTKESTNSTITGVTFMNNVLVATGTGPGAAAVYGKPTSGWSNNIESTGSVNYFTGAEGNTADFTLASAATTLIGKGATGSGVPTDDVGFDPKCIVKRAPVLVGSIAKGSWWQYDIDIDYIKSIGGVKGCFNPGARSGTPDIGAYKNGAVSTKAAGSCTPPVVEPGAGGMNAGCVAGMGGMDAGGLGGMPAAGGAAEMGGMASSVAGSPSAAGGAPTAGGPATSVGGAMSAQGGSAPLGGFPGTAGSAVASGAGTTTTGTGGSTMPGAGTTSTGTGGAGGAGGATSTTGAGGSTAGDNSSAGQPSGCGCRVGDEPRGSSALVALGLVGLGASLLRRRRRAH